MTQFVTRCPKCSTSFRITQAQLDRAKGAVRCGSCLQIFRATDHLVESQAPTKPVPEKSTKPAAQPARAASPQSAAPKPKAATAKAGTGARPAAATAASRIGVPATAEAAKAKPGDRQSGLKFNQQAIDDEAEWDDNQLIHDDLYEEDEPDRTGELSDSFFDIYEPKKVQAQERSLFDREIKPPQPEDDEPDGVDESWALNILEQAEDDDREDAKRDKGKQDYSRATTGTFSALTDEDLESSLGDSFRPTGQQPKYEPDEPMADEPPRRNLFSLADEDEPAADARQLFTDMEEVGNGHPYDPETRAALRAIQPEPLEMGFYVEPSPWPRRALWGGLSLAALLALVVQIGLYNIDTWGRAEASRPYYEGLCPWLGCQLPSLSDPARVMVSNLVVRSHPRVGNALLIDAVLLNKAPFEQPYPKLAIQFSDLNGQPVAARDFGPREYLGGELAGKTIMPSNQPVHIELEILDPGRAAVNYSAQIQP